MFTRLKFYILLIACMTAATSRAGTSVPRFHSDEMPDAYYVHNSITLPSWLKGQENLMPPASLEQIQEVANLLNYRVLLSKYYEGTEISDDEGLLITKAIDRLTELGDRVVPPMLWLYFGETDNPTSTASQYMPGKLDDYLYYDPALTNIMVPLYRQQLAWMNAQMEQGDYGSPYFFLGDAYLLKWGTDSDRAAVKQELALMEAGGKAYPRIADRIVQLRNLLTMNIDFIFRWQRPATEGLIGTRDKRAHWPLTKSELEFRAVTGGNRFVVPTPAEPSQIKAQARPALPHLQVDLATQEKSGHHGWIVFWLSVIVLSCGTLLWVATRRT